MNIARMNKAELMAEAVRQGKTVDDSMLRDELIEMLNDTPVGMRDVKDGFVPPEKLSGEKRRLMIPSTEGPGGNDPVMVGLNGKVWSIPRDRSVDVPVEVCGILDNAVQTVLEPDGKEADGTLKWRERSFRRFAVQYVQ